MADLHITPIPAFADNYIWLLARAGVAAVVDPGDAAPVRAALAREKLTLAAILVTHHHADHCGGAAVLRDEHSVPVYGPGGEGIAAVTHPLEEGAHFVLPALGIEFTAWCTPGHTRAPVAFVVPQMLFCGDTLFSAGCGRLFEGTPGEMHASLSRLASLPAGTNVFCGHEYTAANLAFALAVEPDRPELLREAERVRAARGRGHASLPSTVSNERVINPFLRCSEPAVAAAAARWAGQPLASPVEVFAALRRWKDGFRPPAPV